MKNWRELAEKSTIEKTIAALKENGVTAVFMESGEEAKQKVAELLPADAEVMDMTSVTLETLGIAKEITESGKYKAVKNTLKSMNRETQNSEMQKLGAAPEWVIGSVHAVTEDGKVLVASNTGSQLPAYAYGAPHVIWVVGAQKIVKNLDEAMQRLQEYVFPLENERAKKAYGINSNISKLFILHKEVNPNRITMIIVNENLGF